MQEQKIVTVGGDDVASLTFSNELPLSFILGPCAMESREHALEMSYALKELAEKKGISIVYKSSFDKANRTSNKSYRGVGIDKGLEILAEVREKTGLPVITDVHTAEQCRLVGSVADMLQIPAFLCRQTDLLVAAAQTGKAINVKKGQFLAPWDMANVAKKIQDAGNNKTLLCERGTSFGYNTLVNDMKGLPIMAQTGCPIIFDATHSVQQPGGQGETSGGDRRYVEPLARAAVAIGVAGVFMETHENPDKAPSDGPNMIVLKELPALIDRLMAIDRVAKELNKTLRSASS
tara:strand:+ start:1800 stop:2672 length:873 start_codon:yes stop_codon:yes gene_type:complete